MLETIQIPILLKAIDFVFEEGRKILEERRERRKRDAEAPTATSAPAAPLEELPELVKVQEVKQDLFASRIPAGVWQNHEAQVQHLVRLLEIYSRNYHLAKEQYARWGSALVPSIVVHNMVEAENAILDATRQLEALLAKIYDKDIKPTG